MKSTQVYGNVWESTVSLREMNVLLWCCSGHCPFTPFLPSLPPSTIPSLPTSLSPSTHFLFLILRLGEEETLLMHAILIWSKFSNKQANIIFSPKQNYSVMKNLPSLLLVCHFASLLLLMCRKTLLWHHMCGYILWCRDALVSLSPRRMKIYAFRSPSHISLLHISLPKVERDAARKLVTHIILHLLYKAH